MVSPVDRVTSNKILDFLASHHEVYSNSIGICTIELLYIIDAYDMDTGELL